MHDNRHLTEKTGEYLGAGHGRKHVGDVRNQHLSDNHTNWGVQSTFNSTYSSDFKKERRVSFGDKMTLPKISFHRYPRRYSLPLDKEMVKPSKNTVWWSESAIEKEPGTTKEGQRLSQFYLVTADDHLKKNSPDPLWKYSYKKSV